LDWVVMKALEKDRNRRYGTPASFAEDVDRYLRREAILARPPSAVYKMKKFAQRHRVGVLTAAAVAAALLAGARRGGPAARGVRTAAAVAAALLAGTAVATWQAVRATQAEAAARRSKEDAEAREAEIRAVLRFVEDQVFAAARPGGQAGGLGHAVTLRKALEAA